MRLPFVMAAAAMLVIAAGASARAASCGDEIARFRRILDQDIKLGRVDKEVYAASINELGPVTASCNAGKDAAAIAGLRAVKKRHGYPQ